MSQVWNLGRRSSSATVSVRQLRGFRVEAVRRGAGLMHDASSQATVEVEHAG